MTAMDNNFAIGDQIEFSLPDKDGELHWFPGLIHGVRDYDESENTEAMRTYLVDTGRDERVDEYPHDPRDDEITARSNAIIADDENPITDFAVALKEVRQHDDLPKSEIVIDTVRQPEQLELGAESIRRPGTDTTVTLEEGQPVTPGSIKA